MLPAPPGLHKHNSRVCLSSCIDLIVLCPFLPSFSPFLDLLETPRFPLMRFSLSVRLFNRRFRRPQGHGNVYVQACIYV